MKAPSPMTLQQAQAANLAAFNQAVLQFISSSYSPQDQYLYSLLASQAPANSAANVSKYIAPINTWLQSVLAYQAQYTTQLMAITDPTKALALQWDFTQTMTVPQLTLAGALSQISAAPSPTPALASTPGSKDKWIQGSVNLLIILFSLAIMSMCSVVR